MKLSNARGLASRSHGVMAILFIALLSPGNSVVLAQQTQQPNAAPAAAAPKIPNDQLDSLVAPIALYPDPLLSQTLVASTYPLEVIQLQQWLEKNKSLKGKALADAVEKQKWDPSIQGMAALPDAVKQLAGNISWTTDLGNAFLAQQTDVMDAVQRMRAKANAAGNLKSSQQQKVETKTVESKTVIVIQQADPQVVYVPTYNPTVVYGVVPVYPYPPIVYPPGYGMLAFGAGIAIGAAWGNGGWGYGCGWGHSDVTINVNNKYVNNYNKTNINNANVSSTTWQHNTQHRGAAPYNQATATKYSGANGTAATAQGARGGSAAGVSTKYGNTAAVKTASGNAYGVHNGNVYSSSGNSSKSGGGGGSAGGSRPSGGASTMPSSRGGGGNAFGGGGGGDAARASSSRGGHSMGGGGFSRGGGGGGGGRRR